MGFATIFDSIQFYTAGLRAQMTQVLPFLDQKEHKECQSEVEAAMDQRKYERIKARLMQKKREAGDALRAIAHKPGNPLVSREYGKAMDRHQKKRGAGKHYQTSEMTLEGRKPKRDTAPAPRA